MVFLAISGDGGVGISEDHPKWVRLLANLISPGGIHDTCEISEGWLVCNFRRLASVVWHLWRPMHLPNL